MVARSPRSEETRRSYFLAVPTRAEKERERGREKKRERLLYLMPCKFLAKLDIWAGRDDDVKSESVTESQEGKHTEGGRAREGTTHRQ